MLQTRAEVQDVYDSAVTGKLKKEHTQKTLRLIRNIQELGIKEQGLAIMAGPCNFCDVCGMPEGLPCPHEGLRFSCLSAYCIDAGHLARSCGMEISLTGNVVSFFSLYLFGQG